MLNDFAAEMLHLFKGFHAHLEATEDGSFHRFPAEKSGA